MEPDGTRLKSASCLLLLPLQEVLCVEEESTSCYCLVDPSSCHLLLDRPGSYALVGEPLTQGAAKRLKLAVFGGAQLHSSALYCLRVYCMDDTPHALQVSLSLTLTSWPWLYSQQVVCTPPPAGRLHYQQRPAGGAASWRSQRCCLSERTPSACRCPSMTYRTSCGASNPSPRVR